jgi:hypothetical protein
VLPLYVKGACRLSPAILMLIIVKDHDDIFTNVFFFHKNALFFPFKGPCLLVHCITNSLQVLPYVCDSASCAAFSSYFMVEISKASTPSGK